MVTEYIYLALGMFQYIATTFTLKKLRRSELKFVLHLKNICDPFTKVKNQKYRQN